MTTQPPSALAQRIEELLAEALQPVSLQVRDDSAKHAGHAGAREGGHFTVIVVSASFTGKTRIARHRLVYDVLAPLMRNGIHALAIEARSPDE